MTLWEFLSRHTCEAIAILVIGGMILCGLADRIWGQKKEESIIARDVRDLADSTVAELQAVIESEKSTVSEISAAKILLRSIREKE